MTSVTGGAKIAVSSFDHDAVETAHCYTWDGVACLAFRKMSVLHLKALRDVEIPRMLKLRAPEDYDNGEAGEG